MESIVHPSNVNVGKISDLAIDPDKLRLFPWPITLTCSGQFTVNVGSVKTAPVAVKIAILPHQDSKYNPTVLAETSATFKAVDAAIQAQAANWNITVPNKTLAYATFSKVNFLDTERDAILFVTNDKANNRLYLKSPSGTHVWYSDAKVVYCKQKKLFVLDSDGYSMYVDFGLQ